MARGTIAKIEVDYQFPTVHTLKKLADALGVTMDDLIEDRRSA
ncbi:MAG: helix-turn-helix transcriptional regulator [Clostridiales bacterium]|nr:helix-turn-helix transcriptional regulator [Clostridiales bacterium]